MKKLIEKDKKLRLYIYSNEKSYFIFKSIFKNSNFFNLLRWCIVDRLNLLLKNSSKTLLINKCLISINKKRFNKLTIFSRSIFLKLIRQGFVVGVEKSS
jgi:hypothetical protein